jgi:hypothetical protein
MSAAVQSGVSLPSVARLTPPQLIVLGIYGVVLWFLAALMIHYGTPAGIFSPRGDVPVYAATAAGCYFLIKLAAASARLRQGQLLPAIAWASLVALLCDGFAIAWTPGLYGTEPALLLPGIAWLSFAVGVSLLAAMVAERN